MYYWTTQREKTTQRVAKSAKKNYSIIITEKITNLSNEYANYSINQYLLVHTNQKSQIYSDKDGF